MEELKAVFGEASLSYDEFMAKVGEAQDTIKLANLQSGKYVDKDKLNKAEQDLKEYKNSTKDYATLKQSLADEQTKYNDLQSKYTEVERMRQIDKSNVNPKFSEFVYSKVSSMVTDDKDFQTCLTEYLKENQEFLNTKQGNYADLQNGSGQQASNNDVMNNMIRKRGK